MGSECSKEVNAGQPLGAELRATTLTLRLPSEAHFCFDSAVSLEPPPPPPLSGEEAFEGVEASVADFWRFAMSDLRTNNVRGYLAEFLVARAVGSRAARVEWDPWDVTAPDGTKIEVKSAGFVQAWAQARLSRPTFRVAAAYGWDPATGAWSTDQGFNADVYVFCLHTATSHDEYNPLQVAQWRFYVASRPIVEAQAGARMGLATLRRVCGEPVAYDDLAATISKAVRERR